MAFLYILTEDDSDDLFFKRCIEKLTGRPHELISRRLRKNSGYHEVVKKTKILINQIKHTGHVEETFFVIAVDNDRSPAHPGHEKAPGVKKLPPKEQMKTCRYCGIVKKIKAQLGNERDKWPIQGAVAVPVQMLESWLLLILNSEKYVDEASLPIFAKQNMPSAKAYYSPHKPPKQLKDLCEDEKDRLNLFSAAELISHCVENLKPDMLEEIAPSFSIFKKQVDAW